MNSRGVKIGLDIGTSMVRAVAAEMVPDEPMRVIGVAEVACDGLQNGTIVDVESTSAAITECLARLEESAGIKPQEVTVGISGEHIVSLNCEGVIRITEPSEKGDQEGLEITSDDVDQVLEAAKAVGLPNGRQIIHVIPQQFLVDDQKGIRNPVRMIGSRLEAHVHLVTSAINATKNIVSAVKRAGVRVNELVLEPLAAAQASISPEERQIGVCLIDIGAGNTDIIVLGKYGVQYSRSLPVGSMHISSDIAKILRITEEQAETLKLEYGTCYTSDASSDKVFEVKGIGERADRNLNEAELAMYIEARMDEILRLITQDLGIKGAFNHMNSGIVFTGGGSQLRGLLPLARKIFNLPVRIARPQGFDDPNGDLDRPEFSVAAGLVSWSAKHHGQQGVMIDKKLFSRWLNKVGIFFKENF